MKLINKISIFGFLAVMLIPSCVGAQFTPKTAPTIAMETALAEVRTAVAETQTAQPTLTSTPTLILEGTYTAIPIPGLSIPVTPQPDRQVYTDPDGWYTVSFPVDWKPVDNKPNSFAGTDRFFETGYLPEMGYVTRAITACIWFANVEVDAKESEINWMSNGSEKCSVESKMNGQAVHYSIMENPGADPAHRFVYLKQGYPNGYFTRGASFSWTKPVYYEAKFDPGVVPISPKESDFWGDPASLPSNISVTEFALPPEVQTGPTEHDMLLHFVPDNLMPEWVMRQREATSTPYKRPTIGEQLAPLGYELRGDVREGNGQQLFRDGRLLFDKIVKVSDVYNFQTASGPINAFVVNTIGSADVHQYSFLVENDAISAWEYGSMDLGYAPILYQDELLWAKVNQKSQIEVKRSNRGIVFTFETFFSSKLHMDNFRSWNDHWILEAEGFVVQDGEILNEKFGYSEMFNWGLVKDKPTYFFRKGSRIGISHNGKVLPIQYQDVAHGLCCSFASNNPYTGKESINFFGKRDGVWYYVLIKFK